MIATTARDSVRAAVLAAVVLVAAACGSATPSGSPSTADPSPVSSLVPSATSVPSPVPSLSPSAATACPAMPRTGLLPSDRLSDLNVSTGPAGDVLTFVFGSSSLDSPAGPPQGSLDVATPPYTEAGSGAPISINGEHVIVVRFSAMSLQNDAGEEIYTGPPQVRTNYPALRQAVRFDASEGVVGWYVGYDGTGCATLGQEGSTVTVTIAHS